MDIPTQIIKLNIDVSFEIFHSDINKTVEMFSFLSCMKMAKVTPIYKKRSPPLKDNSCPVSIFPNLLEVFQRCLYEQVSPCSSNVLSKIQYEYRNPYTKIQSWTEIQSLEIN